MLGWLAAFTALDAAQRGDLSAARQVLAVEDPECRLDLRRTRYRLVILPALLALAGDHSAWGAARRELDAHHYALAQRPWLWHRFLAGAITAETFLAQPWRVRVPAELVLLTGLRADLAGDVAVAHERYAAWLALPCWQRFDQYDPLLESFVRWRAGLPAELLGEDEGGVLKPLDLPGQL